jgi:transcriptional regulator with XRE-family HTH domain
MRDEPRYNASRLAQCLRDQGRKQRWLAEKIGTHESLVSEWVNGRRSIGQRRAQQVADALGIPFYLLFDVTEETKEVTGESAA